jgi:hypothetical protein
MITVTVLQQNAAAGTATAVEPVSHLKHVPAALMVLPGQANG